MPDQHVSDFTAVTDGMKTGDVLHMQRLVGADWVDYKVGTYGVYGGDWQTAIYERQLTDPTITIVNMPGAGQIHLIGRCYAVWHPGTTNDSLDLEVRVQGIGTTTGFNGIVTTGPVANANVVYTQLSEDLYLAPAALQLLHSTTSTSDGTYTFFIQYKTVPFPS
jgi:hypothetical protein